MSLESHYKAVIKGITEGRVVPFFGAGVNLCDRPANAEWQDGQSAYLPSGGELAEHLAATYGYQLDNNLAYCPTCNCEVESQRLCSKCGKPIPFKATDLARVSEYVELATGAAELYGELHRVFDKDYEPTSLHKFFARFPSIMREKRYSPRPETISGLLFEQGYSPTDLPRVMQSKGYSHYCPPLLIVTTNYDDLMEIAFREAGELFDTLSYVTHGDYRGKFLHWPAEGTDPIPVEPPNVYGKHLLTQYPVILKMHGAVRRKTADHQQDHYVITEDHYIDYLTRTDISDLLPATIVAKLRSCHFLFLGYGLRDSNLKVILHRIRGEQKLHYKSWAIQPTAQGLDKEIWRRRNVDILEEQLVKYVEGLSRDIGDLGSQEAPR